MGKGHRKLLYSGAGPAVLAKLGVALLCKRCLLISRKQAVALFPVDCSEGAPVLVLDLRIFFFEIYLHHLHVS